MTKYRDALLLAFILLVLLFALVLNWTRDAAFQEGATSGAHDLCQELGGTWTDNSWCDIEVGE